METNRILNAKHLRAVIFDFDGTLSRLTIDFDCMREVVSKLLSTYNVPEYELTGLQILEMITKGHALISRKYPDKANAFYRTAHKLIEDIEIEAAQEGFLFEGVTEMLTILKRRGIKTGIVTRNCFGALKTVCADIHIICDVVMTRESIINVKPHPDHLKKTLEILNTRSDNALMIGDHPMDIVLGKNAGTVTAGVLTGNSEEKLLRQAGADIILEKATHLMGLIFE